MPEDYKKKDKKEAKESKEEALPEDIKLPDGMKLDKDAQKKLKDIKDKISKFEKEILKKFDNYIMGIELLPPRSALPPELRQELGEAKKEDEDKINVLVLIDDSDSKTMTKEELKDKIISVINKTAEEIDKNLVVETILLSELWQNCYDSKYEILKLIAMGAPVYDKGMLSAVKISEIHKTMVLRKFEKYIVSYVLAGSLVQGRATKDSDIDVWLVVDDTDVKRMTRAELKDKLRAIIIGMGIEAGEMTGIRNKLNIQVYILTDFWDSLKEANPIIFTLLRDGVPLYDRGIFMPWKQLLKMGKIKPSAEAIDMFMASGAEMLTRVKMKIKELGMEDIFYAILTPSQAALMMFGIPPPAPKETANLMREIFVKKEKIFDEKYVAILDKIVAIRKDIEYGKRKELSGKEVDDLIKDGEEYLEKIKDLFAKIEVRKDQNDIVNIYDAIVTVIRDIFKAEGVQKVEDNEIVDVFYKELIVKAKLPSRLLTILKDVMKAKKDFDSDKLNKQEVENVKKNSAEIVKALTEYSQRKKLREREKIKIKVRYDKDKFGNFVVLKDEAFIIREEDIKKTKIDEQGSIGKITESSFDEFETALEKEEHLKDVFINEKIIENIKKIFGNDVEVLANH